MTTNVADAQGLEHRELPRRQRVEISGRQTLEQQPEHHQRQCAGPDPAEQRIARLASFALDRFDSENGIATPTMNRKNGKIRSVGVQPCQSACSSGP